jgi:NAD(P)-dependent dehydrogenase (short-subunit alcohol dehydrogenase family)
MTSTSSFEGKRALVTGGSRGIGAAIVRRLASYGAAIAVLTQDGHLGATYELGGTLFTLSELAATISDVLGYQDMSVSDHTGVLTASGLPRRWPPPSPTRMPAWLAESCSPLATT